MKKLSAIIIAMALVLGLSQCKKQETPTTPNDNDGKVYITVNVSDGAKHEVYPSTGAYVFTNGDVLYVGNDHKYIGTLEYQDGAFSGEIYDPQTTDYLHFYFVGGLMPSDTPVTAENNATPTTSFTVNISNQATILPVLSYGHSTQLYTDGNATYSTTLRNKCALVKFVISTASSSPICIKGMKNKVEINFQTNGLSYSMDGEGVITVPAGGGEQWAILLPQEALAAGMTGSAYALDGNYFGSRAAVPAISENGYLTEGIAVTVNKPTPNNPVGSISGLFTVNDSHNQVYFSKGNLQYIGSASTPYWKFADYQWDVLGSSTGQNSTNTNVDRDLFAWGTSGYNHGATYYEPWRTNFYNSAYYAYGDYEYSLNQAGQSGKADWGYNKISNGGDTEHKWRTLTKNEWEYVINTRNTASGIRYAMATVNNVNGVILLPDDWDADIYTLNSTNTPNANFNTNIITAENWNELEINGAVFLPSAGYRWNATVNEGHWYYWTATSWNTNSVYVVNFYYNNSLGVNTGERSYGYSVRLVRSVQ